MRLNLGMRYLGCIGEHKLAEYTLDLSMFGNAVN